MNAGGVRLWVFRGEGGWGMLPLKFICSEAIGVDFQLVIIVKI